MNLGRRLLSNLWLKINEYIDANNDFLPSVLFNFDEGREDRILLVFLFFIKSCPFILSIRRSKQRHHY